LASARVYNVVWLVALHALLIVILRHKTHQVLNVNLSLESLAIVSTPLLVGSSLLYYTDAPSTLTVLALAHTATTGHVVLTAALGVVALCMRQTNIVWVAFACGDLLYQYLSYHLSNHTSLDLSIGVFINRFYTQLWRQPQQTLTDVFKSLFRLLPFSIVFITFVSFVYINKGLAFGDASAHQPSLHIPQLFYFSLFTCIFGIAHLASVRGLKTTFHQLIIAHPLRFLAANIVCLLCVHYFTYEHAYLLADNRHYTFYIWRRLFKFNEYVRYALVPVYVFALMHIYNSLTLTTRQIWRIGCDAYVAPVYQQYPQSPAQ
jgi:alpha-1,2-glucosyltransferase